MTRPRARILFLLILAASAIFRLHGIDWDAHHHLHPDERFISMVEEKLSGPKSFTDYLDSRTSRLNPYNLGYGSFVYGTLPMLLAHFVGRLVGKTGYDGTFLVGRALSALFDLVSIWLVYRMLRRFTGRKTSLLGAGLLAASPLAIQLSHFWTVETYLTTFTTATLYAAVRIAQGKRGVAVAAFAGAALGLAVACKITGLALALPVAAAVVLGALREGLPPPGARTRAGLAILRQGLGTLAIAAVVVRLAFPYAFAGNAPFSFRLDPRWIHDLEGLTRLTRSVAGFPPNFQWAGRGFLFPIRNIVLWGATPFLGLPALAGVVWAVGALTDRRRRALLPLLLHVAVLIAYHGLTMVKSIRYLYPVYPVFAVFAALFLERLAREPTRLPFARARRALPALALAGAFLCALAFDSIYRREVTRVTASRWIYQNIQPPRPIANETWDDGLPLPMPGYDNGAYGGVELNLVGPDDAAKVEELLRALGKADTIAVTSNRAYGSLTRLPDVFPMTIAYYRALFEGRAGFRFVGDFTSYPSLGPLRIRDDAADEAFTVYDHPRVLLFRKGPDFSLARLRSILLAALPPPAKTLDEWEKWPRKRRHTVAPLEPPRRPAPETTDRAVGTEETGSLTAAILWYLALAAVGVVAFPIAFALFPRLEDRGFGFARILGLILATWMMTVILTLRLASNGRGTAIGCFFLLAAVSAAALRLRGLDLVRFLFERGRSLLESEIAFALGFLLFLGIRALNPEIYWGEKPMDFSILNILARTPSLPPSDPWFSGAPLGYYFFGQEMVVFLSFLTGLSTRYTFNLAFGLLGGTILQGAFALVRNWGGTRRAGIAGAALTVLLGNLAGLREWLVHKRALDWDYFWATSRVVKDTINEYPFWSLVFADLHAHVLAIPTFLLFCAASLHFVKLHAEPVARWPGRLLSAIFLGFLAAAQALTNAWDVPLLTGLLILVPLCAAFAGGRLTLPNFGRAAAGLLVAASSAYLFTRPLWVRMGQRPALGRNLEPSTLGIDQLTVFGLFFFLAVAWWLAAVSGRLADRGVERFARWIFVLATAAALAFAAWRAPNVFLACGLALFLIAFFALAETQEDRLAFGFIATAFFLILYCQRIYIYDRMNTFFKLYLEAWLLFAVATAVLVFRSRERRGALETWALPARLALLPLVAAAAFTSVTAGRAAVSRHFAPYSGPSLDGLRYLQASHPGEYRAVLWLRQKLKGTPVVLEAQGPSYQDFGRISMNTGLPTILGWDYHVKQRGNPESEIETRREVVKTIYSSPQVTRVESLLRRYRVGYVYVGWLERKTYPPEGLRKFRTDKELFQLAYENPEAQIYRVAGGDTQDVVTPARETLPEKRGPEQSQDEPEERPAIQEKATGAEPPYANLKEPRGAAVDDHGRLWVADFGHSRIRVYDPDGGFLGGWGGRGSGEYGLREPCGIAIRGEALYIADTWNGRIQAFTVAGASRASAGGLYGPRGVAVAPDGRVWVTDTGNHRVVSYDAMLQNLRIVGERGSAPGRFANPIGIAVGPSGSIYVADVDNRRIQVLGPNGEFVRAIPFPGWRESGEPHLVVDDNGTIYAADPASGAVQELDAEGRLGKRMTADESGQRFDHPTGVALDRKTRILYVIGSGNNSVSKIRLGGCGGGPCGSPDPQAPRGSP